MKIGNDILYLHAGKTGGSTIEKLLVDHFDIKQVDYSDHDYLTVKDSVWAQHNTLDRYDLDEFKFKFATIRHPVERFLSAFAYNQYFWCNLMQAHTVREFLEVIPKINETYGNNHFLPQHHYTHIDGVLAVDELIRVENFEEDTRRVFKQLEIPVNNIPNVNPAKRKKVDLTPDCITKLEEIYSKDFELYNY